MSGRNHVEEVPGSSRGHRDRRGGGNWVEDDLLPYFTPHRSGGTGVSTSEDPSQKESKDGSERMTEEIVGF